MDFEDYALAGLGTAGGLALGGKVVGQHLGNKWGEQGYYRSKASSLGTQSDADIEYQQAAQQIANSELPPKIKQRELQKLQLQRQKIVGKSLQNMERDAENSRGWNRSKGLVAGTLGTAAVGGALGLGYGLSNDFSNKRKTANFFDGTYEALGIGAGAGVGLLAGRQIFKNKGYNSDEENALQKYERYSGRKFRALPDLTDEEFASEEYTPEYEAFRTSLKDYRNKNGIDTIKANSQLRKNNEQRGSVALSIAGATGLGLASKSLDNFSNTGQGQYYAREAADGFENLKGAVSRGFVKAGEHLQGKDFPEGLRYRPYNLDDWGHHSFNRSAKKMTKFTRKHNSTYVQFKKAYNQAVANFIDPSAIASEGIGDYLGLGLGSLAGAEIGRAGSAQIKAKALRRSADPNERHNQMLATQLEAAQQIQDPVQRAKAIAKAQSQADYESAKLQRWAGLKGGLLQAGYTGLGATTGLVGNTIAHHWNN